MDKERNWKQITKAAIGALLYTTFVFAAGFCQGEKHAKAKHKKEIQVSKQTIENHEAKLDTIRHESDSAAVERFRKDNRPD